MKILVGFVEATGAINFRGESNDFGRVTAVGGTALMSGEFQMSGSISGCNWPRIKKSVDFHSAGRRR